jgi:hypothetical protein
MYHCRETYLAEDLRNFLVNVPFMRLTCYQVFRGATLVVTKLPFRVHMSLRPGTGHNRLFLHVERKTTF